MAVANGCSGNERKCRFSDLAIALSKAVNSEMAEGNMTSQTSPLLSSYKAPKKSPVSGHRSASKLVRWRAFIYFGNLIFLPTSEIHDTWYAWLLEPDHISHTQCMVAKRGCTNRANVHTPMWKSHLKYSASEFQSIQQFWLAIGCIASYQIKRKLKMPTRAETRNRILFWGPKMIIYHLQKKSEHTDQNVYRLSVILRTLSIETL